MANNVKVTINEGSLTRFVEEAARKALPAIARRVQPHFDRLLELHGGEPVETVIPHVRALLRETGLRTSDSGVREYAQQISSGRRIVLQPSSKVNSQNRRG